MSLLLKNRYQILEVLSEAGGFGQTFTAVDTDTPSRRKCVIKKLRPVTDQEDFEFAQQRFHVEAAVLERLGESSDQIPTLYAYFVEDHEFYLVQEFVKGLTLRQRVRHDGILNENSVRELLGGLLDVLEYVHSQNIIHRDIKPDNVILRQNDGKPVLIDFGIVKEVVSLGADGNPTQSLLAGGTPGYTAPEQAAGRPAYASDLYSLGATAIFLLTARSPQQMIDLATGDIAWQPFAPRISPALSAILNKSTQGSVRDRYQCVAEMRADLQRGFGDDLITSRASYLGSAEEETVVRPDLLRTEEETVVRPDVPQLFVQPQRKSNQFLYFGGLVLAGVVAVTVISYGFIESNRKVATGENAAPISNSARAKVNSPSVEANSTAASAATGQPSFGLDSPSAAYRAAYNARKSKDIVALKKLMSKDVIRILTEMGRADQKKKQSLDDMLKELCEEPQAGRAETRNEQIDGDKASVEYLSEKGDWEKMDFIKEDGVWKLTIDMPTDGLSDK